MKRILFFIAVIFFTSCENQIFNQTEMVEFSVSDLKESFFEDLNFSHWKIEIISAENTKEIILPKTESSFKVKFEKNIPSAVSCEPIFNLSGDLGQKFDFSFFYPAGTIYPYEKNLSWQNGFCSQIFKSFLILAKNENSSSDIKEFLPYFNWQKFISAVEEKSLSENYNPFACDTEKIAKSILNKTFSKTYLSMKNFTTTSKENLFSLSETEFLSVYSKFIPENLNLDENEQIFSINKDSVSTFVALNSKKDFYYLILTHSSPSNFVLANTKIPLYN